METTIRHREALSPRTAHLRQQAGARLTLGQEVLLGGGPASGLLLGHGQSEGFDFFSAEPLDRPGWATQRDPAFP